MSTVTRVEWTRFPDDFADNTRLALKEFIDDVGIHVIKSVTVTAHLHGGKSVELLKADLLDDEETPQAS